MVRGAFAIRRRTFIKPFTLGSISNCHEFALVIDRLNSCEMVLKPPKFNRQSAQILCHAQPRHFEACVPWLQSQGCVHCATRVWQKITSQRRRKSQRVFSRIFPCPNRVFPREVFSAFVVPRVLLSLTRSGRS